MEKIIIAAMAENRVIGKDGEIPWHHPEDMEHFRRKTMGNPVLMGRKTYFSLPEDFRPLEGRKNLVLTRSDPDLPEEVVKVESFEESWERASEYGEKVFIAGGSSVYEQTLGEADKMIITIIHEEYEGDSYFPEWNEANWGEVSREEAGDLSFVEYVRN